jgi:hypothetical protein
MVLFSTSDDDDDDDDHDHHHWTNTIDVIRDTVIKRQYANPKQTQ